jgi:hypothetical protein
MMSHWVETRPNSMRQSGAARLAAALLVLLCAQAVIAEEAQPAPPPPVQEQQKPNPGVLESIMRWFEDGAAKFKTGLQGAKGAIEDIGGKAATVGKGVGEKAAEVGKGAADATKGAVDAVIKLPSARLIEGRERCDVSPNGAPDCRKAAETICRGKGFAGGKSADFISAENCPAAVWMNRRKAEPGECTTETFVTRAMCQ